MEATRTPLVLRLTIPASGVEVVTVRTDSGWLTTVHGGALDGETFAAQTELGALVQHGAAEQLVLS